MTVNGKELKRCTDDELTNAWWDVLNTPHDLADAIVSEIDLRRKMRAASPFHEPPVPELN